MSEGYEAFPTDEYCGVCGTPQSGDATGCTDTCKSVRGEELRAYSKETEGCGEIGPEGYFCTHHDSISHIARGTEPDSFAEAWPLTR